MSWVKQFWWLCSYLPMNKETQAPSHWEQFVGGKRREKKEKGAACGGWGGSWGFKNSKGSCQFLPVNNSHFYPAHLLVSPPLLVLQEWPFFMNLLTSYTALTTGELRGCFHFGCFIMKHWIVSSSRLKFYEIIHGLIGGYMGEVLKLSRLWKLCWIFIVSVVSRMRKIICNPHFVVV